MLPNKVEFEERWEVSSGAATIIPMHSKWKAVGVSLSAGLDSALLLYLTVKTIQKHNLNVKVVPVSIEIYNKVKNIESTVAIIKKIKEITQFTNWGKHVKVIGSEAQARGIEKDLLFENTWNRLFYNWTIDFELNGITKNPPDEVRIGWKHDDYRQFNRDDPKSIYCGELNASPHAFVDKKDIIEHYINHNLVDELIPLTLSCDEDLDIIKKEKLSIPCGKCWWCSERRWGLESHNLSYEKSSPLNAYTE